MEEKNRLTLHSPTQAERLGRFAVSHFVISVLGALLAMSVGYVLLILTSQSEVAMYIVLIVCSTGGMAAYAVAGFYSAETYRWSRPKKFKNGFLAFLFPALIAWAWGSLMLYCTSLSGVGGYRLVSGLLTVNVFVALPSLVMVVTSLVLGLLDGGLLNMIICMLLAGGLPPLMFLLGSIWGNRQIGCRAVQPNEETEVSDGTQ